MNVLSLFDGMSCGRIALNRIGVEVDNYFSSEVDKYAIKVADDNHPQDTKYRLGDVREIDTSNLPEINLLIGGSPCQSFSFAGKRKGMSTKDSIDILDLEHYLQLKAANFEFEGQSYLFWEFVRVLHEVKPKYFLLENVKMVKKWQDVLSGVLGVEPILINSALVSAQSRPRLYWTNIPNVGQPVDKGLTSLDIGIKERIGTIRVRTNPKLREVCLKPVIGTLTARYQDLNGSSRPMVILDESEVGKAFDSGKVPTSYRMLTPVECERLQTVPDGYSSIVSDSQRRRMLGNGWTVDVIAHIFKGLK